MQTFKKLLKICWQIIEHLLLSWQREHVFHLDASDCYFIIVLVLLLRYILHKKKLKKQFCLIREYDVPYHVRAAIDLKIFVVSEKSPGQIKVYSILSVASSKYDFSVLMQYISYTFVNNNSSENFVVQWTLS